MSNSKTRPFPQQPSLKAAMKLKGYTAKSLAEKIGLSPGYVTLLLNGFAYSPGALAKIGRTVGVKLKI